MRRDLKLISSRAYQHAATLTVLALPLLFSDLAFAAKAGHGRVSSAPGQALQITLPLLELNPQDQQVLQVKIAAPALWSKAGLVPPVPLDTLNVALKPGLTSDSRELVISSNQKVSQSPVDILLEVTTATGALQIQSSYLVLLPAEIAAVNKSSGAATMRVSTGDTLYGIAQRHAVPGTDIYQMLMAIFEANPKAFIAGNMNLLRAGADLNIPDADAVRAIDALQARAIYQKHLSAFNQRRGLNAGKTAPLSAGSSAQSGSVMPAAPQPPAVENADQLRLSAANSADQRADAKVSAAKEIEELQSRIKTLQQNVNQLKESIGEITPTVGEQGVNATAKAAESAALTTGTTALQGASVTAVNQTPKDSAPTDPVAASSVVDSLTQFLSKNILATLTALIALSALAIAWMLRRAGARRDDDSDDLDAVSQVSPAIKSAFDQKLQSISLDLDDDLPPAKKIEPVVHKPN
jgi:pilus assembly protein FimV